MSDARPVIETVVLDLDGTLVDSVYQHVASWQAAFRDVGLVVSGARIHRCIGMGGDRVVAALAGEAVERSVGDRLRDLHTEHFERRFHEVRALDGASELLEALGARQLAVVLATSGEKQLTDRLLELVDGAGLLATRISGADPSRSKPAPDLIEVAMREADADRTVVVGDAVWDVEAAGALGVPCIGLLSGGISESELTAAGASWVFDGPRDLVDNLGATPLG